MKVVLVKEAWRNTGFLVDQALLPDSEFLVFMQGIPLFLGWHLGDATVAEMFIQLVVFALPVSRVETQTKLNRSCNRHTCILFHQQGPNTAGTNLLTFEVLSCE